MMNRSGKYKGKRKGRGAACQPYLEFDDLPKLGSRLLRGGLDGAIGERRAGRSVTVGWRLGRRLIPAALSCADTRRRFVHLRPVQLDSVQNTETVVSITCASAMVHNHMLSLLKWIKRLN